MIPEALTMLEDQKDEMNFIKLRELRNTKQDSEKQKNESVMRTFQKNLTMESKTEKSSEQQE
jgi:hypothetical protein